MQDVNVGVARIEGTGRGVLTRAPSSGARAAGQNGDRWENSSFVCERWRRSVRPRVR